MRAIMTVTGIDHTGIIAAVTTTLAKHDVNITNVSQTLMDDYFTMIMQLDFDEEAHPLLEVQEAMRGVEAGEHLVIRIQADAIFRAMHTL